MKGSTGITIVFAIGIACLIAGSLTNNVNAYETDDDVTTLETTPLSESTGEDADANEATTSSSTLSSTDLLGDNNNSGFPTLKLKTTTITTTTTTTITDNVDDKAPTTITSPPIVTTTTDTVENLNTTSSSTPVSTSTTTTTITITTTTRITNPRKITTTPSTTSTPKMPVTNLVEEINEPTTLPTALPTPDPWIEASNFFVFITPDKIFTRPYFTKNVPLREIHIDDSSSFFSRLTMVMYNGGFTFDCSHKKIYILKKPIYTHETDRVVDVIQYDGENRFQRIREVRRIFYEATSIASDWNTGNIYWIEHDRSKGTYSIKFTNELFEDSEYVIEPTKVISMRKIQVYPKKKVIFFTNATHIWYTSTLPNSTPKLLFTSRPNDFGVYNLVIDYALDKLCWDSFDKWYCVYIGGSTRPLSEQDISSQPISKDSSHFVVLDNKYYWHVNEDQEGVLYSKNDNDESEIIESHVGVRNRLLSLFSPNCLFKNDNKTASFSPI